MNLKKILCIQHRQMGDVLMCTPSIKILREKIPNASIHFLTEKLGEQVLENNINIDQIISVDRKMKTVDFFALVKRLRKEKYDAVIDFFSNPKSAQLTFLTGAGARCGFANWSRNWAFNRGLEYQDEFALEYAALTKSRLLGLLDMEFSEIPPIEMDTTENDIEFAANFWSDLDISPDDKIIAFCPVSRRDYKIWEPENYAFIADSLVESENVIIWMVYGPGEYNLVEPVVSLMRNSAIINYPMPNLQQLRALYERCTLYFGNDGGNKHIAITAGLPTVTVFRQLNPENWTPPNSKIHITFAEGNPGQEPLGSIKKEDVLEKIKSIL